MDEIERYRLKAEICEWLMDKFTDVSIDEGRPGNAVERAFAVAQSHVRESLMADKLDLLRRLGLNDWDDLPAKMPSATPG